MRINKFIGRRIHGFYDFDVKFNSDLTFLVGINGSGKTSILTGVIALISPSLSQLADLNYSEMRVECEHDGLKFHISAVKHANAVHLSVSGSSEPFEYVRFVKSVDAPTSREAEYEHEYYRELTAKAASHPVFKQISLLPTPMFLGLDRRPSLTSDRGPAYNRQAMRLGRNVFGSALSRSVADAALLVEDTYRSILIAAGRIADDLRRDMILGLLEVNVSQDFVITAPSREDIKEIDDMRRELRHLPDILRLPRTDVESRLLPLLENLQRAAASIPKGVTVDKMLAENSRREQMQALLTWTSNAPQLRKIKMVRKLAAKATEARASLLAPTEKFTSLINMFLKESRKQINFDQNGYLNFAFDGNSALQPITALSSGEAQIFVILAHLFFNEAALTANVFMIDEPELSLHIQWQEMFVDALLQANPKIQYVMATHSPSIILERTGKCVDTVGRLMALGSESPKRVVRKRARRVVD
jgi:predicted ATP-binding protein involved in virulence